jgi:hypothetical protein
MEAMARLAPMRILLDCSTLSFSSRLVLSALRARRRDGGGAGLAAQGEGGLVSGGRRQQGGAGWGPWKERQPPDCE